MDSTAIGSLLGMHVSCQRDQREYALVGVPGRLKTLFNMARSGERAGNGRFHPGGQSGRQEAGLRRPDAPIFCAIAMKDSISRKAVLLAVIVAGPPVVVLQIYSSSEALHLASLFAGVTFVLAAWLFARSLTRRIHNLTAFVDRLLDQRTPRARLNFSNDELGELARSLFRVAPQIDELFNRVTTELARREAILASMIEGVLAVDARLHVTFCNQAFLGAIGDHGPVEGQPLLKIVRDPDLFRF